MTRTKMTRTMVNTRMMGHQWKTVPNFIATSMACIRVQGQILSLPTSRRLWLSPRNFPWLSTSTCTYWTICVFPANWWLGQKWPWSPLEKPPARQWPSKAARKPSFTARTFEAGLAGWLWKPTSEQETLTVPPRATERVVVQTGRQELGKSASQWHTRARFGLRPSAPWQVRHTN